MNLEHEDKGYQTTGQSGVPWSTSKCTSCLMAIRLLKGFQVKPHLV